MKRKLYKVTGMFYKDDKPHGNWTTYLAAADLKEAAAKVPDRLSVNAEGLRLVDEVFVATSIREEGDFCE